MLIGRSLWSSVYKCGPGYFQSKPQNVRCSQHVSSYRRCLHSSTSYQAANCQTSEEETISINSQQYTVDEWTNYRGRVVKLMDRNLHNQPYHPICLIKQRIVNYINKKYSNNRGNPLFALCDNLNPVVTTQQNFDSLLVPPDHVSRLKTDSYYINSAHMLRAHTSAHQSDLLKSGLDCFLVAGDVYRRDTIDSSHFPAFHQMEGVRLYTQHQLYDEEELSLLEEGARSSVKQGDHTLSTRMKLEEELKTCLEGLASHLFGADCKWRWVETKFPFTHPSWELEIYHNEKWMEMLGCGIMEQQILRTAGIYHKAGYAFGLGLDRLAMILYKIPDIRILWSTDTGILAQFKNKLPEDDVTYKAVSVFPQCSNDVSFWLPQDKEFHPNDFYDLVRTVGGDLVEQVDLKDEFLHPKTGRLSHMYRIVYRAMDRTLTQEEVNTVHTQIVQTAATTLHVQPRT